MQAQDDAGQKVDFVSQVKPILEATCLSCHGADRPKGGLRIDTLAATLEGGDYGPVLKPGKPEESTLYTTTILPPGDEMIMPPKGDPLAKEQTEILRRWILQGAEWPEGVTLQAKVRVDFVKDVQPVLETQCVACHRAGNDKGGLRLDEKQFAFLDSANGKGIVPGKSSASLIYTSMILPEDHDDIMPPTNSGGPLPKETSDVIRFWIDSGAFWPEGVVLVPRKVEVAEGDETEILFNIHQNILANNKVTTEAEMEPYTEGISGSQATFEMVPIPSGTFLMGSPVDEEGRRSDEGPQVEIRIPPFWMGKHEVTWNEFELFMYPAEEKKLREIFGGVPEMDPFTDTLARPTQPYVEMSFGMGKDGYPAISMTQYAASKYCQWLSAKTGHFYRLPTEAEWEYACRAGTTSAYSFGDDLSLIDEYAWYTDNSDWKYQKIGLKKPNPWGLYDMHGNVSEWCLDQYHEDAYINFEKGALNPWNHADQLYPRVVRGGSWDDDPETLRSAHRIASDSSWKTQDPQLPKSIWYHTDAQFLGFRVVRPLEVPADPAELVKYWPGKAIRD